MKFSTRGIKASGRWEVRGLGSGCCGERDGVEFRKIVRNSIIPVVPSSEILPVLKNIVKVFYTLDQV